MARKPKAEPEAIGELAPGQDGADEAELALLAAKSLKGDIRDFILDRIKNDHSAIPWNLRGEAEQRRYIDQTDAAALRLVHKVALVIASKGRVVIGGRINKAALKDHIAVEVHVGLSHPERHKLTDAVGGECLIVLSNADDFEGDRGKPTATPDQGRLIDDEDSEPEGAE